MHLLRPLPSFAPHAGALPASPSGTTVAEIRRVFDSCFALVALWQERAEQRHALADLDSHMLKDIGVSASEAYRESRKPSWSA